MRALALERREEPAKRRAPDDRSANGGEAAARGDRLAVDPDHARAGDAAARMRPGERDERRDGVRRRHGVGIRDDDELAGRGGDAPVGVGREAERPVVREHARLRRDLADAARDVLDHDELVHLRGERGQRRAQVLRAAVRDDDAGDARHGAITSRYAATARLAVSSHENRRARSRPARERGSASASARRIAAARPSGSA